MKLITLYCIKATLLSKAYCDTTLTVFIYSDSRKQCYILFLQVVQWGPEDQEDPMTHRQIGRNQSVAIAIAITNMLDLHTHSLLML